MSQPAEKLTPVNEAAGPRVRDVLPGMQEDAAAKVDVAIRAALNKHLAAR
jgi:hypothetical protein